MKIGLFSDTFRPDINGVANSTYILFTQLKKMGHEVYVVAPHKGAGFAEWDENHEVLRLSGIQLKQLYGYVLTTPFHLNALNEIRGLHLDIIHCQTEFGVGMFAHICAKQLNIPLVCTYHTTYEDYTHYVNIMNSETVDNYAKKLVAKFSKLYGDSSMAVFSPSEKTKELLQKYGVRTPIHIVPTGLDLAKFDPTGFTEGDRKRIRDEFGIGMDEKVIIYVGRIAEEKALDLVIRGFAEAKRQGLQVRFLVVGGGPDLDGLKEMAASLGLEDMVIFAGPRKPETIQDYYRSADAFVSASLSETQGMTFIEAMASGLPLFARRDEVLENLLIEPKTGWYFTDENDFAQKLELFLHLDAEAIQAVRANTIAQVRPYNSEVFAETALKIYSDVIRSYAERYTVEEIRAEDDQMRVILHSADGKEETVLMSYDDYYEADIRVGHTLSVEQVKKIKDAETALKAYRSCVRRISLKDRTVKEVRDWLEENTECTEEMIRSVIGRLEKNHLLDDERYCREKVAQFKHALYGEDRIRRELLDRGIPFMTVEEELLKYGDEEDNAVTYAEKISGSITNESLRMKKDKLQTRLIRRGFHSNIAKAAVEKLNFEDDELRELDSLHKCVYKALKRYGSKYTGRELRSRIYRYCMAQGYSSEDIQAVLDETEWNEDD